MENNVYFYENGNRISRHKDIDAYIEKLYGKGYKNYRNMWKTTCSSTTLPVGGYDAPLHLVLEPNDSCNLKCPFCFRHAGLEGKQRSSGTIFEFSVMKKLIDEAASIGVKSVALSFGEPLLHPDIATILKYIASKQFLDVFLYTNGTRLNEELISLIVETVTRLHISIDAATDTTYRIMRGRDLCDLRKSIDAFIDCREKTHAKTMLWVSFLCHPENLHEKEQFIQEWHSKADLIDFQYLIDAKDIDILQSDLAFVPKYCAAPHRSMSVRADGTILPCCTPYGAWHSLGTFPQTSLLNAWKGSKMLSLQQNLLQGKFPLFCQNCLAAAVRNESGDTSPKE